MYKNSTPNMTICRPIKIEVYFAVTILNPLYRILAIIIIKIRKRTVDSANMSELSTTPMPILDLYIIRLTIGSINLIVPIKMRPVVVGRESIEL